MKNVNIKTIIIGSVIGVLVIALAGIFVYRQFSTSSEMTYTFTNSSLELNHSLTLEYQKDTTIDPLEYVEVENGEVSVDTKVLYQSNVGDTEVTYTFVSENNEKSEEIKCVFTVADTQAPRITLNAESVDVETMEGYDPMTNITSVEDPVDGALSKVDTEPEQLSGASDGRIYEVGWYTVNVNEDHTVAIKACDNHGNVSESSFVVNVTTPEVTPTPTPETSSVETLWQYTAVELGDDSAWSQLGSHYDWVYTSCSYLSDKYSTPEAALQDVIDHEVANGQEASYVSNNARIFMDKDANGNVLYYQAGFEE